jgi:hypothetical protein
MEVKNEFTGWHVISIVPPKGQGWLGCKEWCLAMVGPHRWRYQGEGVFEFACEKDAVMFQLRWV